MILPSSSTLAASRAFSTSLLAGAETVEGATDGAGSAGVEEPHPMVGLLLVCCEVWQCRCAKKKSGGGPPVRDRLCPSGFSGTKFHFQLKFHFLH